MLSIHKVLGSISSTTKRNSTPKKKKRNRGRKTGINKEIVHLNPRVPMIN
jgi:hypothetical protein